MKTAVLYLRQSVTRKKKASVSLDVQEKACRAWAEEHGYEVVGVFRDPNTSGSKSQPRDRKGWSALMATDFDVAVVYKSDRLARDVTAFWVTVGALLNRDATLASATEPLDLISGAGRIMAGVQAGLAEMTASEISERVAGARQYLVTVERRAVGGKVPYGWRNVLIDPEKPKEGMRTVQDPETIDWVRGMVERVQAGMTIYGVSRWLTTEGAPTPAGKSETFRPTTVERIVRHPIVAGMTPFNPGNKERARGDQVLIGSNGLPVVDKDLAVMSVAAWRKMLRALDNRASVQARPRSACGTTSALLSGLVFCSCGQRMWRGKVQKRDGYKCPAKGCGQAISNFEEVVVEEFMVAKGDQLRWRQVEEVVEGGAALLPEIENRLDELDRLVRQAPDRETRADLQAQQASLLDLRDEKRAETPIVSYRWEGTDQTFGEDWAEAATDEERRAVLDDALERIVVSRGRPGRRTREQLLERMTFAWKSPEAVGPMPVPDEAWVA